MGNDASKPNGDGKTARETLQHVNQIANNRMMTGDGVVMIV